VTFTAAEIVDFIQKANGAVQTAPEAAASPEPTQASEPMLQAA